MEKISSFDERGLIKFDSKIHDRENLQETDQNEEIRRK